MVWDAGSLQTRLHARRELALPAHIEIHADHSEQLRFSFPDHQGRATVIDVSEGGLGLHCSTFLPKLAKLDIRIELPATGDGPPPAPKTLRAVVRRCTMKDVKPTYQIGLQYLDPDPAEIADLIRISESAVNDEPVAGGAT